MSSTKSFLFALLLITLTYSSFSTKEEFIEYLKSLEIAKKKYEAQTKVDITNFWGETSFCDFLIIDQNDYSVSYNLSYWYLPNSENEVLDEDQTRSFKYFFNVCGALSQSFMNGADFPEACRYDNVQPPCEEGYINQTSGKCMKTVDISQSHNKDPEAVQIIYGQSNGQANQCFWLSSYDFVDGSKAKNFDLTLLDTVDSAKGIVYHMQGGSYCEAAKRNRELQVIFKCPDSPRQYFSPSEESQILNESVAEYPTCVYNILIESPLACPSNCIHKNRTKIKTKDSPDKKQKEVLYGVCGGRGICAMDEREAEARCLCDTGFSGDLCNEYGTTIKHIDTTNKSIQILVIFCIIILAIVFILVAWLYSRLKDAESSGIVGTNINQAASLAQPITMEDEDDVVNARLIHEQDKKQTQITTGNDVNEEDHFPGNDKIDDEDRVQEEEDNRHEDPSSKGEVTI